MNVNNSTNRKGIPVGYFFPYLNFGVSNISLGMHCDIFKAKTMWKVLTISFALYILNTCMWMYNLLYFWYNSTAAQVNRLHFPMITKVWFLVLGQSIWWWMQMRESLAPVRTERSWGMIHTSWWRAAWLLGGPWERVLLTSILGESSTMSLLTCR